MSELTQLLGSALTFLVLLALLLTFSRGARQTLAEVFGRAPRDEGGETNGLAPDASTKQSATKGV